MEVWGHAEPSRGSWAALLAEEASPTRLGLAWKVEENVLMVDTANVVEEDNTKPVTSAAVYVEIGNIEALLASL